MTALGAGGTLLAANLIYVVGNLARGHYISAVVHAATAACVGYQIARGGLNS